MHGQVHEDVDLISADFFGQRFIAEVRHVMPRRHAPAQACGDGVRPGHAGIRMDVELGSVVPFEKWRDEIRLGVLPEVRRDVTDSQTPLGIAVV